MKYLMIVAFCVFISACGGGDNNASETMVSSDGTGSGDVNPATEITSSDDLAIDPNFNLSTQLDVILDVKNLHLNERAFLNVCIKPAGNNNHDKCILKAPLTDSDMTQIITLAHREMKLTAEVWFYDTSREPLIYEWQHDPDFETQVFTIE